MTGVSTLGSTSNIQVELASIATTSTDPDIAAAQQAVLDAQQVVDDKLAVAGTAVTNASTVCAAMGAPPTTDEINACQTAISAALAAQHDVQAAQDALVGACDALDALLQDKANQAPTTTQPNTPSTGSAPGGTRSGAGGTSTSPSSADLVAYQKAIDSARLEVAVAQQALNQATIASPIDGVVVAVSLTPGLAVDAASQTQTIVVQGDGGYEATMLVSVQRVSDVRVGQRAIVIPDRSGRELEGEVAYISTVPDADSTSSSYLVVIGLKNSDADDLRNGETATATIVLEQTSQALAIPTSALTTQGSRHIVQVLEGGEVQNVSVEVGVIGATWTEITTRPACRTGGRRGGPRRSPAGLGNQLGWRQRLSAPWRGPASRRRPHPARRIAQSMPQEETRGERQ